MQDLEVGSVEGGEDEVVLHKWTVSVKSFDDGVTHRGMKQYTCGMR